jgi:hypothetical protein
MLVKSTCLKRSELTLVSFIVIEYVHFVSSPRLSTIVKGCLAELLMRGSKVGAGAVLEDP